MRALSPAALVFVAVQALIQFAQLPALGQEFGTPSAWLEQLDREHHKMVSPAGHVHATGQVEEVDVGPGTIILWTGEIQSRDGSIWMPPMRMKFHATNRRMLQGLKPGDAVAFEAARLRNSVMITSIRKLP